MWGCCGHRHRLVITTQGIDPRPPPPPPPRPRPRHLFQRQWLAHELCAHIDQLIESYCLKPWVIIEGGITLLLFRACVWESALPSSLSQHTLPADLQRLHQRAHLDTHTCSSRHKQRGPNEWMHWLPSLCNYVPIVYFPASYSFKRNSIIIALFNVKVTKSGGRVVPVAALSLSVSMTALSDFVS